MQSMKSDTSPALPPRPFVLDTEKAVESARVVVKPALIKPMKCESAFVARL
jgi:hypothetical protein